MLKSVFLKCPVTSLKIFDKFLLSGQGYNLVIYSIKTNILLSTVQVFNEARIHNIIANDSEKNKFLIIGGKSVCCLQLKHQDNSTENVRVIFLTKEKKLKGWIWDGHWEDEVVYLISAHNTVLKWDIRIDTYIPMSSCFDQCILYSATFAMLSHQLVVAVGTVFNKVLLWKPLVTSGGQHCFVDTWKSFSGHDGVIFSIRFHSDMDRMLSVSDDRSIRIWSIEDETCLNILYGHTARVWDACYMSDHIVSIGEDTVCIVWTHTGNIVEKLSGHQGKSIWSLAVDHDNIITGGGDGGIRRYQFNDKMIESKEDIEAHSNLEVDIPNCDNDFPRSLSIYESGESFILVVTNNGYVWKYCLLSSKWIELYHNEKLASYTVSHVDENHSLIVIGNLSGDITILSLHSNKDRDYMKYEESVFDGKIFSVKWLMGNKKPLLMVCGPNGLIKLLNITQEEKDEQVFTTVLISNFLLPYSKQRWVTCAVAFIEEGKYLLVCGDRRGSIHVFHSDSQNPVQSMIGVHGKTGVTFMSADISSRQIFTTGRDGTFQKYILQNSRLNRLDKQKACKGMVWLEGLKLHEDGDVIYGFYMQSHFLCWNVKKKETIFKVKCGGGYRAWDVSFIQNGERNGKEVGVVFAYLKEKKINVCYDSRRSLQTSLVVVDGLHGNDIMKTKVLFKFYHKGDECLLIASCSEDTTINFYIYHTTGNVLNKIHTAGGHIGGVKDFDWLVLSEQPNYICYFFSCGSRTSLKCWKLQFHQYSSNTKENMMTSSPFHFSFSLVNEIYNPELKLKSREFKDQTYIDDMRYICCEAFFHRNISPDKSADSSMWIICACSDGLVRIYLYWRNTFELAFSLDNHRHCIQNVNYVITENKECFVIACATDGFITLWRMTQRFRSYVTEKENLLAEDCDECDVIDETFIREKRTKFHDLEKSCELVEELELKMKCHQSGLNCIQTKFDQGNLFIVTGGDDNALCYAKIHLESRKVLYKCHELNAHLSAITGVSFFEPDKILSTSIDQRIKVWKVDESNCRLSLVTDDVTNVADAKHLFLSKKRNEIGHVIVSGVGMEIFTIS